MLTFHPTVSYRLCRLTIWIHAEPNAAIVAACIPVLRILFRDVARSYGGDYGSNDKGGKYIKSTTRSTFHGTSTATATAAKHDDDSEASILNDGDAVKQPRIHKTQQVTVEFDDSANQTQFSNKQAWQSAEDIEMGSYKPAHRRD